MGLPACNPSRATRLFLTSTIAESASRADCRDAHPAGWANVPEVTEYPCESAYGRNVSADLG